MEPRASIRYGYAERVITPREKISLAGYFRNRFWDSVKDDLFVKALYLESGDQRALLVSFDLCFLSSHVDEAVAKAAGEAGIPAAHIIACATHTHTGPALESRWVESNPAYTERLCELSREAVAEAVHHPREGAFFSGRFDESRYVFNRRYWMKDGRVQTNPGKRNPDVDKAEGGIDPEVHLAVFGETKGKYEVLLVNLANHVDTIGGTAVSSDWPGVMRRRLVKEGVAKHVLFLLAPSGNLNHFDIKSDDPQTSYAEAERLGGAYAESILKHLGCLKEHPNPSLKVNAEALSIQPRVLLPAEMEAARRSIDRGGAERAFTSEDFARDPDLIKTVFAKEIFEHDRTRPVHRLTMTHLDLGACHLLSLPGEPFFEIGTAIRAGSDRPVMLASLTGGSYRSYIPMAPCLGRGGYETESMSSPCAPDTAQRLVEAASRLIEHG